MPLPLRLQPQVLEILCDILVTFSSEARGETRSEVAAPRTDSREQWARPAKLQRPSRCTGPSALRSLAPQQLQYKARSKAAGCHGSEGGSTPRRTLVAGQRLEREWGWGDVSKSLGPSFEEAASWSFFIRSHFVRYHLSFG